MDAIYSVKAGLLFIIDDEQACILDKASNSNALIQVKITSIRRMISDLDDIRSIKDASFPSIIDEFDTRWRRDRAVRLLFIAIDPFYKVDTRRDAATVVDSIIQNGSDFFEIRNIVISLKCQNEIFANMNYMDDGYIDLIYFNLLISELRGRAYLFDILVNEIDSVKHAINAAPSEEGDSSELSNMTEEFIAISARYVSFTGKIVDYSMINSEIDKRLRSIEVGRRRHLSIVRICIGNIIKELVNRKDFLVLNSTEFRREFEELKSIKNIIEKLNSNSLHKP